MNYFVDAKSFIEWVQSQKRFSKKTNLDNMKYFCKLLCNPESSFKAIHVTGTNGKGSTVAMLTSVLMAKGYNVGTFTSCLMHRLRKSRHTSSWWRVSTFRC